MRTLSVSERQEVLDWVFQCIGASFGRALPEAPAVLSELPRCGVFVTLHLKGRLRGCIGFIEGRAPLDESLKDAAHSAAFSDPRFPPLSEEEWLESDLEISLLSPLEEVESPGDLEMGEHGALIQASYSQGLFLPQVATEQGWDRNTFMDHLCMKAGLPMEYWKSSSFKLYRFTAQVFGNTPDSKD